IGSKARIPTRREVFSNNPPIAAPSTFALSAAPGVATRRNSNENSSPANTTGTEKTAATAAPTTAGSPGILANGIQYAAAKPASNGKTIQILDTDCGRISAM